MTGNSKPPDSMTNMADAMVWTLAEKAKALEPILTPAQMDLYSQQQASQSKLMKDVLNKMDSSGGGK
jgi:hypothetical protein